MNSEVNSEVLNSNNINLCAQIDNRMGEINVPNAGAIHNPTIEKQANELEQINGKRRFRSITGTMWCDDYELRQQHFDKVCKVWCNELKFVCYGAIERTEENKKPHCHFLIMFDGQKQWKTIIKTLDPHVYHIEAARKVNAAYSYCRKEDPDNMLEYGEAPKQGTRTDLMKIIEENNAEIEKIQMNATNEYMRYKNGFEAVCNTINRGKRIMEALKVTKDKDGKFVKRQTEDRAKVYWYYGPAGVGKTRTVEDEIVKLQHENKCNEYTVTKIDQIHNEFFVGDIAETSDVLWIDDFRGSKMKYDDLLTLLDGRCVSIKGGYRYIKAKYVFITSPFSPRECYHNLAAGDGIEQLERRITQVISFRTNNENEFIEI